MQLTTQIYNYLVKNFNKLTIFFIIGIGTFAIYLAMIFLFYDILMLGYKISISISYLITVFVHFFCNRKFTYKHNKRTAIFAHSIKYLFILLTNYTITISIAHILVGLMHCPPYLSVLVSSFFTAFSSFLLMNHFVFSRI